MKQTLFILSLLLSVRGTAYAQDAGQIGISIGYPAAIGIVWHVTDSVAVRPDISFSTGSAESTAPRFDILGSTVSAASSSDSTTVTVGVSGLLYLGKWDHLRTYVSPRFSYGRLSSSSGTTVTIDNTNSNYTTTGSFGAQYQIHRRFAVFGETGFGYSHSRTSFSSGISLPVQPTFPVTTTETVSTSWGTRSGAGVIFYFK